jgi:hypothetical protein
VARLVASFKKAQPLGGSFNASAVLDVVPREACCLRIFFRTLPREVQENKKEGDIHRLELHHQISEYFNVTISSSSRQEQHHD